MQLGGALALLSAVCWSGSSIYFKKGVAAGASREAGMLATLLVNFAVGLLLLPFYLPGLSGGVDWRAAALFALGGILNSATGRALFFACINRVGVARAEAVKGMTPAFALLFGIILLDERLSVAAWCGFACVMLGLLVLIRGNLRRENEPDSAPNSVVRRGLWLGVTATFFFASGNYCRKAGLLLLPLSLFGYAVGAGGGLLFFILFLALRRRLGLVLAELRRPEPNIIIAGLLISAALCLVFGAMALIPLSIANSLTATEPIFALLLSRLLLKKQENVTLSVVATAVLMTVGAVLLLS